MILNGSNVGNWDGAPVGCKDEIRVGNVLGISDGERDGSKENSFDGLELGLSLGECE